MFKDTVRTNRNMCTLVTSTNMLPVVWPLDLMHLNAPDPSPGRAAALFPHRRQNNGK